jgi:hypothetical protein
MLLSEAHTLLVEDGVADNHRYFTEMYKQFHFTDGQTLKEYLEFILHEPKLWMEGFPSKLTTKQGFAKPKTAIIKLLKKPEVARGLGTEFTAKAHDAIWKTFKLEHESILKSRTSNMAVEHIEMTDLESVGSYEIPVPSVRAPILPNPIIEDRTEFLKALLVKMSVTLPDGVSDAFRMLVERV